ncbi:serine protease grass-like [Armigeres subalbatus]|uniref:serine protease grass-like n=1 Tax=Armigeres subalbatus TaxID=124917 RepID=UPI002ED21509
MGITTIASSFVPVALLLCVVAANNSGCPAGKGICVQNKYCLAQSSSQGKRHKCFLENKQRGVCCDRRDTTLHRNCTTIATTGPGTCLPEEQCGKFTRDFLLNRKDITRNNQWKNPAGLCYQENRKNYYCCPLELQNLVSEVTPTKIPQSWNDNAFPTCKTKKNKSGRCVPLRLCDEFHARVIKRNPFLRYENLPSHYKCLSDTPDSTSICCADPAAPDALIRHAKAKKLFPDKCGTVSLEDRILEGTQAVLGEFPWMANLMYHRGRTKTTLCSGSLIHQQYVLTAAHCSKPGSTPFAVRLGEHDLSNVIDCVGKNCTQKIREYAIARWIPHMQYNKHLKGSYDIALVKLDRPALIIPGQIYPICLPITEQWLMMKPAKLVASGWGLTSNDIFPDILMQTTLQILEKRPNYCKAEQMICARGANKEGHCAGDSGGPLQQIVQNGKRFRMVLFGVISAGAKSCSVDDTAAGLSVLVGYHMQWILDHMDI